MRTTLNIRDEALELARRKAEEAGVSVGDIVSEAIVATYCERAVEAPPRAAELPVGGRGGLQPGIDLDSMAALEDQLEDRG